MTTININIHQKKAETVKLGEEINEQHIGPYILIKKNEITVIV